MHPYIPHTKDDIKLMLERIGVSSIDELFDDIPKEAKLERSLMLPSAMSELEVMRHMKQLASQNGNAEDHVCFLGNGVYDHYIPTAVHHLIHRGEFYTAYTPYQPEISQGTLQGIFEFQTMICQLTGMDVANASMYDGATAAAEAVIMAEQKAKGSHFYISEGVHDDVKKVIRTYATLRSFDIIEIPLLDGHTDVSVFEEMVDKNAIGVLIQSPNKYGLIEDISMFEAKIHEAKGLLIAYVNPISLGILKSPGELGADIVVGEGQTIGNSMQFGGPHVGFMATTDKLKRKLPGRIVGESTDIDGKRAFVLTLQAREQHIRREKASSNICSNQSLNAIAFSITLALLGPDNLREMGVQSMKKAHYLYDELMKIEQFSPHFESKQFFNEFLLDFDGHVELLNQELYNKGYLAGQSVDQGVMFCVTEKRTKEEIDGLVQAIKEVLHD